MRTGDGLTPPQRIRLHLESSEIWVRFSGPIGNLLLAATVFIVLGGLIASVVKGKQQDSSDSLPTIRVLSFIPTNLDLETEVLAPPPQAFDQSIGLEVWRTSSFVWPAAGKIIAAFGAGDATGITIETDSRVDIRASSRGTVSFVETGTPRGSDVTIDHEGGIRTLYAGLSEAWVTVGQRVERRQVIGKAAGPRVAGNQMHFSLIHQGEPVDPLRFLPASYLDPALGGPETSDCPASAVSADPASSLNVIFSSDLLRSYSIKAASIRVAHESGVQDAEARPKGPLSLVVSIPPRPVQSTGSLEYDLETIFGNGSDLLSATCRFIVKKAAAIPPAGSAELRLTPTATPIPKATSTTVVPYTPTPTIKSTRVPMTPTAKGGSLTTGTAKKGTQTPAAGARSPTPGR